MRAATLLLALALAGFGGCIPHRRGVADLKGTAINSTLAGTAVFTETEGGLEAKIAVRNAPPGEHGIHIHEKGDCSDLGKAAGGHFNPANVKHGFLPQDGTSGAHGGDMGNITVDSTGYGTLRLTLAGLTLDNGPRGIVGRTVILHENRDDFGQPTGNAGGRIGCGVIQEKR